MTKRAGIQLLLLILSVAFEAVREGQGPSCHSLICFDHDLYLRWHIYAIMEHFITIVLVIMVWQNSALPTDFNTDRFFVILCFLDFIDYLVTGNNVWFRVPLTYSEDSWFFILPFSMNVCVVVSFIIYANWQWRKLEESGKQ